LDFNISSFYLSTQFSEPRKDNKTDSQSSNGNNNALSPQEQQSHQAMMQQLAHDRGEPMIKPERPNSLGPKISKRINFYHENCKYFGEGSSKGVAQYKIENSKKNEIFFNVEPSQLVVLPLFLHHPSVEANTFPPTSNFRSRESKENARESDATEQQQHDQQSTNGA
jgi:hypothetical protein